MRVLLVPELYRPDDATACGTLNDAVTWVDQWLTRDDSLHVYWLLPPRHEADYDAEYVHADRDRVTLIEARPLMADHDRRDLVTEDGYTAAELRALRSTIDDQDAYVDVVVDQRRTGRETLSRWLVEKCDQWAARVRPFDLVANVHDLQTPEKYRWCSHRNDYQSAMATAASAFADGVWFTAGVDARRFREYADEFLDTSVVEATVDEAVEVGSPVAFDDYDAAFSPVPEWLHVAGSLWAKKNADQVLAVAERLATEYGVQTVMTSTGSIPDRHEERWWVDAYPDATRAEYERALARGDLAVCASEYETMARTPFEQVASGQVLVLRDRPWIDDCVPDDYGLTTPLDDLEDTVVRAVEQWDDAVSEARRLLDHARSVRGPESVGARTHRDLADRVRSKRAQYPADGVVSDTLAELEGGAPLPELIRATADHTADGRPFTDRESVAAIDLVYRLRRNGYVDRGNPGTPVFEPVGDTVTR